MKVSLRILSGARAGQTEVLQTDTIRIGRHQDSQLRFDPYQDLEVSTHHATLVWSSGCWYVRDAGSRNGTFLNGSRVVGDVALSDGDRLLFGGKGPEVEFKAVAAEIPVTGAHHAVFTATSDGSPPTLAGVSATQKVRAELSRETRRLRATAAGLAAALVVLAGSFAWWARARETRFQDQLASMRARVDSVLAVSSVTIRDLRGQVDGLAEALVLSEAHVREVSADLDQAESAGDEILVEELRRQLEEATEKLAGHQFAATVDFRRLDEASGPAVALVYVEFGDGEVFTGTAFAVRDDAVLLTNHHVVAGESLDRVPTRIGVQFTNSDQVWPARVLGTSASADLAALKIDNIAGAVPVIGRFNTRPDTLAPGSPVALLGFPLSDDLRDADGLSAEVVRRTLWAGTLSQIGQDRIEVSGYGAVGASGSPILDAGGEVIGVLFGGRPGSEGRIVFGVPSRHATRLLETVPERE